MVVRYLWYLVNDENFWIRGGTAQPFVKVVDSLRTQIPLPPLAEQERIVGTLDDADGLRLLRRTACANLDRASSATYRAVSVATRSMLNEAPVRPLAEVADVIRGVTFSKEDASGVQLQGHIPILRAGNIGRTLATGDDLVWVPEGAVSKEQRLLVGDVVICMSSGSPKVLGKTAALTHAWYGSVGAFCAIIRFRNVDWRYGAAWLRSYEFALWRDSQAQGANIQNLRKSELERVPMFVPSFDVQREFATRDAEIRDLAERQSVSSRALDGLYSALLSRAQRGDL